MLYISRFIEQDIFGVVDTDDGVEQVVNYEELTHAVSHCGLKVRGVSTVSVGQGIEPLIHSIHVYQPPETKSVLATKMKVLHNIEVSVYGEYITEIYWHQNEVAGPVTIRLADFGTKCGAFLFTRVSKSESLGKVIIVVDENIEINPQAFEFRDDTEITLEWVGAVVDLRPIRDFKRAEAAFRAVYHDGPFPVNNIIIADEARKRAILRRLYMGK